MADPVSANVVAGLTVGATGGFRFRTASDTDEPILGVGEGQLTVSGLALSNDRFDMAFAPFIAVGGDARGTDWRVGLQYRVAPQIRAFGDTSAQPFVLVLTGAAARTAQDGWQPSGTIEARYNLLSRPVHFEGATSGIFLSAGYTQTGMNGSAHVGITFGADIVEFTRSMTIPIW